MEIKRYSKFIENLTVADRNIEVIQRTKELSESQFLDILKENCKNFSFMNDQLYRNKIKKYNLELFEPSKRNADPLAFKKFFNEIENDPNFPVVRKNSLIGATDIKSCKRLAEGDSYLVIPYDNSKIVFCPIVDLWGLEDDRKYNTEKVGGRPISEDNFVMSTYTKNFKVPMKELKKLPKSYLKHGSEFFISSPCLMVHESKINWLRNSI